MAWYSINPELDTFNQVLILVLGVVLLYIAVERMQKVLINNMPNSEHDRKLRKFEMFAGKVDYLNHILDREDITDKQKLEFFKKELENLN